MTTYKDVEAIRKEEIFDCLGIEKENREQSEYLIPQFIKLNKEHNAFNIWLREDYPIFCKGKIIDETEDLVVVI